MTVTYKSVGATSATGGTIALPGTYATGDLLLLWVGAPSFYTPSTPTGWTLATGFPNTDTNPSPNRQTVLYWKIAGSSETAPSIPTGNDVPSWIMALGGTDTTTPLTTATFTNVTSTSWTAPSLTLSQAGSYRLDHLVDGNGSGYAVSTETFIANRAGSTNGCAAMIAGVAVSAAGATGTLSASVSSHGGNGDGQMTTIGINPASSGGSAGSSSPFSINWY